MPGTITDKSGSGILFAAIAKAAGQNGYVLTPADVTLGPVEQSTEPTREIQVLLTATDGSQYEGTQTVYFNRLDLSAVFSNAGVELLSFDKGPTTTGELVALINQQYGLGFTANDIDFSIAIGEDEEIVTLNALPSSYGFSGSLEVLLSDVLIPLSDVIEDPVLDDVDSAGLTDGEPLE